jgi:hypothetical protein
MDWENLNDPYSDKKTHFKHFQLSQLLVANCQPPTFTPSLSLFFPSPGSIQI